jgi:hypothetical protein
MIGSTVGGSVGARNLAAGACAVLLARAERISKELRIAIVESGNFRVCLVIVNR